MFSRGYKFFAALLLFSFAPRAPNNTSLFAKDLIYNQANREIIANKDVILITNKYFISADHIKYNTDKDELELEGKVIIQDNFGNFVTANRVFLQQNLTKGKIEDVFLRFSNQESVLLAQQVTKQEDNIIDADYACYTACSITTFSNPIWQIKARKTHVDIKKERIIYKNARFEVFGVPLLFIPYFSQPTPKARNKAKSGILAPSITTKEFALPFYFRVKPNLDFTIVPRLVKKDIIMEGQIRYKNNNGQYQVDGSILRDTLTETGVGSARSQTLMRHHIFSNGKFQIADIEGGFNLKKASDPAYLREYYNIYDPYLTSKIYLQQVSASEYVALEALYFQDMRTSSNLAHDSMVVPVLSLKKNLDLLDFLDTSIDSSNMIYKFSNTYTVLRSSNILDASHTYQFHGNELELSLYNKVDLYQYDYHPDSRQLALKNSNSLVKNLTEVHSIWRYPFLLNESIIFEPTIFASQTILKENSKQIIPIDSEDFFESNDLNVMSANRFSGRDRDEYGTRLAYGVNIHANFNGTTNKIFLGQRLQEKNRDGLVGSFTSSSQRSAIYYRFSLNSKAQIRRHEAGLSYNVANKLNFFSSLFQANKVSAELPEDLRFISKASNLNIGFEYNINDRWSIKFSNMLDLTDNAPSPISRTFGVTYTYDCVRISAKIYDNFTEDPTRGIKKVRGKGSVLIGLKTIINM